MNGMNRRKFLKIATAGTCGAIVHRAFEPYSGMMAYALPPTTSSLGSDSVLIIVNMSGGCSYNIAGSYLGAYRDKFPDISYGPPGSVRASLPVSPEQGVHPSLTVFKQEFDAGNLALINLVGLQGKRDYGHDTASDKWQRGVVNGVGGGTGWMGRMTCQMGNSFSGISLSGSDTITTAGNCTPPLQLGNLSNFGEDSFWGGVPGSQWLQLNRGSVLTGTEAPPSEIEKKIIASTSSLDTTIGTLKQYIDAPLPVTFPNTGFGRRCRDSAKLVLAKPLGTRIIYIQKGGFDTHGNEIASHISNFNEMNAGLDALIQTLKLTGNYNRCVIATMSEFGRTFQNDTGTDHGYASPMFLLGGKVNGGVLTPGPQAADMAKGNSFQTSHCDPRDAYYSIVAAMGFDPDVIFPEPFTKTGLQFLKA